MRHAFTTDVARPLTSIDDVFTFEFFPVDLVSSPSLKADPLDISPHWYCVLLLRDDLPLCLLGNSRPQWFSSRPRVCSLLWSLTFLPLARLPLHHFRPFLTSPTTARTLQRSQPVSARTHCPSIQFTGLVLRSKLYLWSCAYCRRDLSAQMLWTAQQPVTLQYFVLLSAKQAPGLGASYVVSFLW